MTQSKTKPKNAAEARYSIDEVRRAAVHLGSDGNGKVLNGGTQYRLGGGTRVNYWPRRRQCSYQNESPDELAAFKALLAGTPVDEIVQPTLMAVAIATNGDSGDGSWGCVARAPWGQEQSASGHVGHADLCPPFPGQLTLTAIAGGLKHLERAEPGRKVVALLCDSEAIVSALESGAVVDWSRNGWSDAQGAPVPHADLWAELLVMWQRHAVSVCRERESEQIELLCQAAELAEEIATLEVIELD